MLMTARSSDRTANWLVLLVSLSVLSPLHAAAPRIFALKDVRIVTAPGQVIENGTLVIRDGLIESVGADTEAPADAKIIAGQENWTVYPAFIDAAGSVALETESENPRPGSRKEETRPGAPHELEAVRAEQAVVNQLLTGHTSIERHRHAGFGLAHVLPGKGVFRGESALILLRDADIRELVLDDHAAQVIALEKSSFMARKYPSSSIGAMATVRQTLLDAQRQQLWQERYTANPKGMPHPEFRASDAALVSVLKRELPVVFVSGAGLDPGRFGGFVREFELRGMTVAMNLGHRSEYLLAADMPVLLPLEIPDKPALASADEALEASLDELQAHLRATAMPAETGRRRG